MKKQKYRSVLKLYSGGFTKPSQLVPLQPLLSSLCGRVPGNFVINIAMSNLSYLKSHRYGFKSTVR